MLNSEIIKGIDKSIHLNNPNIIDQDFDMHVEPDPLFQQIKMTNKEIKLMQLSNNDVSNLIKNSKHNKSS